MPKRARVLLLTLLMLSSTSVGAMAQSATPDVDTAVDDHLAWILGLFEGGAADVTAAEVEEHLDPAFLDVIPADEFLASVQELAPLLGPLELVEEQQEGLGTGEFIGVFEAESGDFVTIALAVDPESRLIAGFFIAPAENPVLAATPIVRPDAPPVASPSASPVAADPVIDDPDAQIALHAEEQDAIREIGEPVVDAVLAGDDAALEPYLSPEMASALATTSVADVIDAYTERQVQMVYAEAGAYFFGQWNEDQIDGVMLQAGSPYGFTLTAEVPQDSDLPDGQWTGSIMQAGLEISVVFSTNENGDLSATLDIPAQGVVEVSLGDVQYMAERPIGDQVDERAFAPGDPNDNYTADVAWADHLLRVAVQTDVETGQAVGIQVIPAIPTPPATDDTPEAQASYHLPFEGTWWVFWGGESTLHNYHAATPSQRYAYDLTIWKDGATWSGDGTANEDYWAWGQEVLAPVAGTVVDAVNDQPDNDPNLPIADRDQSQSLGGNQVVIEVAENQYVFIAHMQQGSVQVAVGDEVRAGDVLGLTGNSGNSSEPHIHIHVQETPDTRDFEAAGVPLQFESVVVDGEPEEHVSPVQGDFIAPNRD